MVNAWHVIYYPNAIIYKQYQKCEKITH